jgi:hypothetical protein
MLIFRLHSLQRWPTIPTLPLPNYTTTGKGVPRPPLDLKDAESGFLTARVAIGLGKYGMVWTCECKCGRLKHLTAMQFQSGNHLSCGKCKLNRGRKPAATKLNRQIVAAYSVEGKSIESIAELHGLPVEEVERIVFPPKKRMPNTGRQ